MYPLFTLLLLVAAAAFVQSAADENCPQPYRRYSENHTYCLKENKECEDRKETSVSDNDKKLILKMHNEYRSKVANGKTDLPKAGNMLQMEWDNELADIAQKLANQCQIQPDCEKCRKVQNFRVGQNFRNNNFDKERDATPWKKVLEIWYEEMEDFNQTQICSFDSNTIGHTDVFSQMIWAKSWRIGCGHSRFINNRRRNEVHVCNYGPKGNTDDQPVYLKDSTACSVCPANTCCKGKCKKNEAPNYDGLCKVIGKDGQNDKDDEDETHHHHPIYYYFPLYYCNFDSPRVCDVSTPDGMKKWNITKSTSGSFAEVVLNGGERSVLNFTKPVRPLSKLCVEITYRRGPNKKGGGTGSTLNLVSSPTDGSAETKKTFGKLTQKFKTDALEFSNTKEMTLAVDLAVKDGADAQYMEVQELLVKEGYCSKQKDQC